MKTILYATDYSENSQLALKYAYSMSAKMEAKLLVIHVFDYPTLLDNMSLKAQPAFPDNKGDAARDHGLKLKTFCERVLMSDLEALQIKIDTIMDKSVVNGIVNKAIEMDAFFTIIGMRGASKLREIIMGSTAKALIQKSACPVLAIPSNSVNTKIETIVYATDFEEEDLGAIDVLTKIAKPFQAKIKIVHVAKLDENLGFLQKKDLEDKIYKYTGYPYLELHILYADDVLNTLKMYFRESNADLIAMLEREHTGTMLKVFHRDLVKRMEIYGKIPLLSFNAKNYGDFHL